MSAELLGHPDLNFLSRDGPLVVCLHTGSLQSDTEPRFKMPGFAS